MALSISTLNHVSSSHLKCFPSISNFTILAFSSSLVPSSASSAFSPRRFSALAVPKRCRFRRVFPSAASGDDNSRRSGELSSLSPEIVVLNVEGMMCKGSANSVKKLLESRVRKIATEELYHKKGGLLSGGNAFEASCGGVFDKAICSWQAQHFEEFAGVRYEISNPPRF